MKKYPMVFIIMSMMLSLCCGTAQSSDIKDKSAAQTSMAAASPSSSSDAATAEITPFSKHGKLRVEGADLVDKNGKKYQLYGMSTHGIAWFPQYVNKKAFQTLRDDWNTNCIRISMYTYENGGYCTDGNQKNLNHLVTTGVNAATELGMYVIIDWHILREESPNVYKDEAVEFFNMMSSRFCHNDNVIYEICNEPNGSSDWSDIRRYAETVIPVIRKNDSDAVIIVGTPTWSQGIDKACDDPLEYDNIMYALHFYADTHRQWLRDRAETCYKKGLPIFISEFNITDSSGNSNVNTEEGDLWMKLISKYNFSYLCWSLSNTNQPHSVISGYKLSGWNESDLTVTGKWLYKYFIAEDNQ